MPEPTPPQAGTPASSATSPGATVPAAATPAPTPLPEAALHAELQAVFGEGVGALVKSHSSFILVRPDALRDVARHLRDAGFDTLMCLSGVDTQGIKAGTELAPEGAPKTWKAPVPGAEIWVVYHLASTCGLHAEGSRPSRITLKVILDRESPRVPTVSDIWGVANWHEREAFDMYGIVFTGHPDLRRILCPEDWSGWPLRKDYVFPTTYHEVPHARYASGTELLDRERARRKAEESGESKPPGGAAS